MVQQLSLFGSINDDGYDLLISTLTTISGNPPLLYNSLCTVWKPNPSYNVENLNSRNQLVEPNRIKLSKELPFSYLIDEAMVGKPLNFKILKSFTNDRIPLDYSMTRNILHNEVPQTSNVNNTDESKNDNEHDGSAADASENKNDIIDVDMDPNPVVCNKSCSPWSLQISDIPAAGNNRSVSMQTIAETIILSSAGESSSISSLMSGLGFVFEFQYLTIGVKFFMKHGLVLELQKIWQIEEAGNSQITGGGFLIKAYINVSRGTDIDRINYTEGVLMNLKKELQGYIELSVPDRQSMDSRVAHGNTLI
ncbi:srb5p [Saccharomyces arboricola H-6]|uniref:Mediator of RNA polymerase II transcription subunit 18 n=1 Tax=Saccharomyces arboricola (strain H-6 / AS 2.3317 / CBS 10644) TaxID=1160507 RepID=J8Q4Y8_SACAR|nr:srb5p [Saccharomyces arboricola H-6]